MLTTVDLDDALLARAKALCGLEEHNALLQEALNALIQRESARLLAQLGGSESKLQDISRHNDDIH
ncbi:VapB protein of antitoxin of type II toxin-antitoxin system [Collimonas sp. PA-H2]|uniref:type II toxin-antitoxin system VapB family antitoxin n=1 Tax=Collimonas sp. PA-H2 TaxID=1881062 RepID=UPI000BF6A332|nr:type II toxin-antitoxin system VapB family antitoxin [Collimonas sp. PA-H2]PFH08087.1 VapB protein of antitoxin of type II toxin-antitoxin system [Collimonas sp. PA-H2]